MAPLYGMEYSATGPPPQSQPPPVAAPRTSFLHQQLIILSVQELCVGAGTHSYPCEIGVVVGSIAEGEKRHFHCLFDPGPVSLGYDETS